MFTDITQRPNKITEVKNKDYHIRMAKALISTVNSNDYQEFCIRSMVNWSFYKGNQWIFEEDLEPFFLDALGAERNRIKIVQNIVRPIVEYHRGNAIRMDFTAKCKSVSKNAFSRKENSLEKLVTLADIAAQSPLSALAIKEKYPVDDTVEGTARRHESFFKDIYEENMNAFMNAVAKETKVDKMAKDLVTHVVLDGIAVVKRNIKNGRIKYNVISPMRYFFDTSAQEQDLSDAEFMGSYDFMSPTTIFEQYQDLTYAERLTIENNSISTYSGGIHSFLSFQNKGLRLPVYNMYWRDGEYEEYGFVLDEFNKPFLTVINSDKNAYTDKDLVDAPNQYYKDLLKGKKKRKIWCDTVRFCEFIPKEYIGSGDKYDDITLAWGEMPYLPQPSYGDNNIVFPYLVHCWSYDKETAEILSPIDSIIDPQRLINRIMSTTEGQISSSRGSGHFIDIDAAIDDEGEMMRKMNAGEPVTMKGRGMLQNSVVPYNNTIAQSAPVLLNVATGIKTITDSIIGGGTALTGGGGAVRATGSVYEMQINQGTLMQEPIYAAVNSILLSIYNDICDVGKAVYADNEQELVTKIGETGARIVKITKDYLNETFGAYIERTMSPEQEAQQTRGIVFQLYSAQLISEKQMSFLIESPTFDAIGRAIREHIANKEEIKALNAKQQQAVINRQNEIAPQASAVAREAASLEDDKELLLKLQEILSKRQPAQQQPQ